MTGLSAMLTRDDGDEIKGTVDNVTLKDRLIGLRKVDEEIKGQ